MVPGHTAFTRMPNEHNSAAALRVIARMAPLVAAYASSVGLGASALMEAVLMMALPGRMCATAALLR